MDSISIVIRSKNEASVIGRTLDEIFSQEFAVPYEVIVVDSGSTDRTVEIVGSYAVRLAQIPPESFTFGYALNYGIAMAKGTIIVNLSAHCIPVHKGWLRELVKPILDSKADATFGRQVAVKGLNAFEEVSLKKHFPEQDEIKGRKPFSNANCAFLKEMWDTMKFDEELSSWEDYLWYFLLKDTCRFQYCPNGAVYHTHPFSLKAVVRRAYLDGRAFKLIKKKYGIDLLNGVCPTIETKAKIFSADIQNHVKLFKQEGYARYIPLIPVVRFFAYKAYWKGYTSIK